MAGVRIADSPFATVGAQHAQITPEDERRAAEIAGLCNTYLKEAGFGLVEVGTDYAIYRNGNGHHVAIRGHRWFCKLSNGVELSGVGFVDLSEVIRGG
jgi:hypothetical protein